MADAPELFRLAQERHGRGDLDGAIAALAEALALEPSRAALHKNLAWLLSEAGRHPEALAALANAARLFPGDAAVWARLARAQANVGDAAAALASVGRAQQAGPADGATWATIGGLLAEFGRYEEAEPALESAARADPGAAAFAVLLAHARREVGRTDEALQALGRAAARAPDDLNVAIDECLLLPLIYADAQDAERWRARYVAGLAALEQGEPRWRERPAQALEVNHHNFLLAYQGEDDLALQQRYSSFLGRLAAAARPEWRAPRPIVFDGGRRVRVGFASGFFRDCTAGRYFERWITGLDAARFERFVYHTAPQSDDFTRRIAAGCEHFAALPGGNASVAERIAADRLDVLVQPEVGMTPLSYLLAALRLAPVQMAGWGHPVTTGAECVDYYLTCGAMEPPDGAAHYSERLVALPGLGVDYAMPAPPAPLARAAAGLPDGKRLYACPQSLFKIHPDMDPILARIAAEDPDAVLVFFQAPARRVSEQFAQRVQRALAAAGVPPRGQVKMLPRMGADGFRRVLAVADVVVDTMRWSGGNTSLDALAAGTPIVSLPGRFMRGRQTAAMLAMIGLGDRVAASVEDYVRLALETARDRELNADLRRRIAAGREALFGRREAIEALAQALLAAAAGEAPGGL